jgi:hypothetical protein
MFSQALGVHLKYYEMSEVSNHRDRASEHSSRKWGSRDGARASSVL